jgi:hypothetical protein
MEEDVRLERPQLFSHFEEVRLLLMKISSDLPWASGSVVRNLGSNKTTRPE